MFYYMNERMLAGAADTLMKRTTQEIPADAVFARSETFAVANVMRFMAAENAAAAQYLRAKICLYEEFLSAMEQRASSKGWAGRLIGSGDRPGPAWAYLSDAEKDKLMDASVCRWITAINEDGPGAAKRLLYDYLKGVLFLQLEVLRSSK